MSECPGEPGFVCIDGWKYTPLRAMIFPTNKRCALCSPEDEDVERQKVDSSNIESVGYAPGPPAVMEIQFKGGGIYQYRSTVEGVIEQAHQDLMAAESKGRHFTHHIRHDKRITWTKVDTAASGEGGQSAG